MRMNVGERARVALGVLFIAIAVISTVLIIGHFVRAQSTGNGGGSPDPAQEQSDLNSIYSQTYAALASIPPGSNAPALRRAVADEMNNELESFVAEYTNTDLALTLRMNLARNAQVRANYLRAMNHYSYVWDALKTSADPTKRNMALGASGALARLLVMTGRIGDADALAADLQQSGFAAAGIEWRSALETETWEKQHPTDACACGLYCLDQLGQLTQPGQFSPASILGTPSSTNGFTAAQLVQIGGNGGLQIEAGMLQIFTNLPVPCIVHLQCEHFVLVRQQQGVFYEVYDPVADGAKWLTSGDLAAEASGCLIVNPTTVFGNGSFSVLDAMSANAYRGRLSVAGPYDHDDTGCTNQCSCPVGGGGPGGGPGGFGGPGGIGPHGGVGGGRGGNSGGVVPGAVSLGATSCGSCGGMPAWFVTEPFLNLWLQDTPLQYQPAFGPPVALHLAYHDRARPSAVSGVYWQGATFGNVALPQNGIWACSWLSYAELNYGENQVDIALPGGGWATFTFPSGSSVSQTEYHHNLWLEKVGSPGAITSLVLHYPDGSQSTYGVLDSTTAVNEGFSGLFYLSAQSDAAGNSVAFSYDTNFYLNTLTAADGVVFTLSYGNSSLPNYITSVTSSYGASVTVSYDSSTPNLISITDAAGITSQFAYNTISGIYQLTTPYGTTSFGTWNLDQNNQPVTLFDRIARITNAVGSQELYAELGDYTPFGSDWPDFTSGEIPTNTPVGTLDTTGRQQRNTFYWNPQQFDSYINLGGFSFNWSVFRAGRIRHWLAESQPVATAFDTISLEEAPSPDGTVEGQLTWYDYVGKPSGQNNQRGTQVLPSVIARVMPDTSTAYQYLQYNSVGKATNETEEWFQGGAADLRTNILVYDANNVDLLIWTNAAGIQAVSNSFNAYHEITASFDGLNQLTSYTYDPTTLLLSSISRPSGLVTTNIFDSSHRLQKTIDLQINRTNSFTWRSSGDVQTQTDERGLTVTYYWDALHRLTGTAYPDGTTTSNLYTVPVAYSGGSGGLNIIDRTAAKDRMNFWTLYQYDGLQRLTTVTNANNVVTLYGYCDCGGVSEIIEGWNTPAQLTTTFDYDFQGHRLHTFYPDATVTNWFDALGRIAVTGDAWGYRYFNYDNLNRLTNSSNAYGTEQATVYDVLDRQIAVTDANGVMVTNAYDAVNRVLARGYPDGGIEKFGYSARGLIAYTNQLTFASHYGYDEVSRKIAETNANGEVLRFTNNAASDLLSLTDGKNQTTKWSYDQYGRVTNKTDQAGAVILKYVYDPDNRLTNRWSKGTSPGWTTTYKYDKVGNLTNIVYPSGTANVTFKYDPLNRVTNMVDGIGTTVYAYASGGQLFTEDGPWSSDTVTNVYLNRLRISLGLQQPTGAWTNGFGYDAAKHLISVVSPAGTFSYTLGATAPASALIKDLLLPNTSYITNTYDGNARLLSTKLLTSSSSILDSSDYGYNTGNQRTTFTNAAGTFVAYAYDNIGQLKMANSSVDSEDRGYSYDAAWNLSIRTNNGATDTFSLNSDNEATTITESGDAYATTYDGNGNTTSYFDNNSTGYIFSYDAENRLTQANDYELGNLLATTTFQYDGIGRFKIKRTADYSAATTNEVHYLYDGMRVIQERDASNTPQVSYTRGTDLSGSMEGAGGIGGLLARSDNYSSGNWTRHNFYHADGNGNITYLETSSQTLAASYRYDAFGRAISQSGGLAVANVYQFSSKERVEIDPEGLQIFDCLYYYGYRFYAPELQRWVNRDPIDEAGSRLLRPNLPSVGSIRQANLYCFNENEPISGIDPLGLISPKRWRVARTCSSGEIDECAKHCAPDPFIILCYVDYVDNPKDPSNPIAIAAGNVCICRKPPPTIPIPVPDPVRFERPKRVPLTPIFQCHPN